MSGPVIDARDYGLDLTGANSSADAMEALQADANAGRLPVQLPSGDIVVDRNIGVWMNGTFVQGAPAGTRLGGTNIIIPAGPNQGAPWAEFQRGSGASHLRFVQPDQTNAGIDASAYPSVTGAPQVYAPCIKASFALTDLGAPGHNNGAGFDFSNLVFAGCYDGVRIRDEAGANQLGVGMVHLSNLYGFNLHTDIELGQVTTVSTIRDVFFGSGLWAPASLAGDPGQKFNRWRRRNGTSLWFRNRAVGFKVFNYWARTGRYLMRVSGGRTDGAYRGVPAGRVNQGWFELGCEQFPTMLRVDEDGYLHANRFRLAGHAIDSDDPGCTDPCIHVATDRELAGSATHEEVPAFRPMGEVRGWTSHFDLDLRETAGEVLKVEGADGHGLFTLSGLVGGWGVGDRTLPAVRVEDGASVIVKAQGLDVVARRTWGQDVFRVPSIEQLRVVGADFVGTGRTVANLDADHRDPGLLAASAWRQEGFEADDSDDSAEDEA